MSSAIPINCIGFIGSLNMKIPAIHGRRSPAEPAIAARTITPLFERLDAAEQADGERNGAESGNSDGRKTEARHSVKQKHYKGN